MAIFTDVNGIIFFLIGITVLLILWIVRLELKMRHLLKGQSGKSLESSILATKKGQEELERWREKVESYLEGAEERLKRSVQNVETIRFNPFKGTGSGGNQSFATAFLNEKGDGTIISSLYARERMSIFSKPIKNYTSEFELTEEEKEVIRKVKETTNVKSK